MDDLKQTIGKSMYIWSVEEILKGNPQAIASALKAANFQSVILHSTRTTNWKQNSRINLIPALQSVGINVFGGCGVYGDNSDGKRAADFCNSYNLAGWVFDAEAYFDSIKSPDSAASNLLRAFKLTAPTKLAGWCWWAFYKSISGVTYHPKSILWAAMADNYGDADFGVPMAYWSWGDEAKNAIRYLEESWKQWRAITDKPIVPAGRAYIGDGGTPNSAAMMAFENRARELGAVGVTWWSMQHALNTTSLPEIWPTLSRMQRFGDAVIPEDPEIPVPAKWYDGLTDHEILIKLAENHTL